MTTSKNQPIKHYSIPFYRADALEAAIHNGTAVKKSETPIMRMIAAQMEISRKLAGVR